MVMMMVILMAMASDHASKKREASKTKQPRALNQTSSGHSKHEPANKTSARPQKSRSEASRKSGGGFHRKRARGLTQKTRGLKQKQAGGLKKNSPEFAEHYENSPNTKQKEA